MTTMGIRYEVQREDAIDRHLVVVLARLTIRPTIVDCMRKEHVED